MPKQHSTEYTIQEIRNIMGRYQIEIETNNVGGGDINSSHEAIVWLDKKMRLGKKYEDYKWVDETVYGGAVAAVGGGIGGLIGLAMGSIPGALIFGVIGGFLGTAMGKMTDALAVPLSKSIKHVRKGSKRGKHRTQAANKLAISAYHYRRNRNLNFRYGRPAYEVIKLFLGTETTRHFLIHSQRPLPGQESHTWNVFTSMLAESFRSR